MTMVSSTPSPTPSCAVITSYLTNGGFESGVTPWTIAVTNAVYDASFTVPRTGSHSIRGRAGSSTSTNILTFTQSSIAIPEGTKVRVYTYVRGVLLHPNRLNFKLYVDGALVTNGTPPDLNGVY